MIGADGVSNTLDDVIAVAKNAENAGLDNVWLANIFSFDAITTLALIGRETQRIGLGTAVTPTYPRHPTAIAQQALTTAAATNNRFTLGIGLSHKVVIEDMLGMSYDKPAKHMREYLSVLMPLARGEQANFEGEQYRVRGVALDVPGAERLPVVIAGLGPVMLKLAAQLADGTNTWMVGPKTMDGHILPALHDAGNADPTVVAGMPIVLTTNVDAAKEKIAKELTIYGQLPSYRAMLDREGAAGPADIAIVGDENQLRGEIKRFADMGVTDFNAAIMNTEAGAYDRTLDVVRIVFLRGSPERIYYTQRLGRYSVLLAVVVSAATQAVYFQDNVVFVILRVFAEVTMFMLMMVLLTARISRLRLAKVLLTLVLISLLTDSVLTLSGVGLNLASIELSLRALPAYLLAAFALYGASSVVAWGLNKPLVQGAGVMGVYVVAVSLNGLTNIAMALDTLPDYGRVMLLAFLLTLVLYGFTRLLPGDMGSTLQVLYRKGALLALLGVPMAVYLINVQVPVPVDEYQSYSTPVPGYLAGVFLLIWLMGVFYHLRIAVGVVQQTTTALSEHTGGAEQAWHVGLVDVLLLSQLAQLKQSTWRWLVFGRLVQALYWPAPWVSELVQQLAQHLVEPAERLAASAYRDNEGWARDVRKLIKRTDTLQDIPALETRGLLRTPSRGVHWLPPKPQVDRVRVDGVVFEEKWAGTKRRRKDKIRDPYEQAYWLIAVASIVVGVSTTLTVVQRAPEFEPKYLNVKWQDQMVRRLYDESIAPESAPVAEQFHARFNANGDMMDGAMLGLAEGDAHVIRNAGGVVTDDVIRSLTISQRLLGTREIMLIHHTDCGMLTFTDADLKQSIFDEIGMKPPFALEAFDDIDVDVRGFVYEVESGQLRELIRAADARVVVFPEMSITGYELAAEVVDPEDARLESIVSACADTGALALVGAPTRSDLGDHISMLCVAGSGVTVAYSKMCLSATEAERFCAGNSPVVIDVDGWRLGLGICKDTGVPAHAQSTADIGMDIYVAGVLDSVEESSIQLERAQLIAAHHGVWVVFASFAGATGGGYSHAAAQSRIWAPDGAVLACAGEDKPNVVLVVMDNLGWGEIGMQFLNFNVETQCTPSRSALMTGRHPVRSGTTKVEGRFPTDQGFDEWYGIANTTDEATYSAGFQFDPEVVETPHILESTRGKKPKEVKVYDRQARAEIDSDLTDRAIRFMQRSVKSDKPFFAYIPYTQVHLPTIPHPEFSGTTGNGRWADVLTEVDSRAGQLLDAIDDLGIRDNTVFIWMSENGPEEIYPHHGTSGPWRGTYFTALEGSLRTPFLLRWPGKVEAGSKHNEIMHITDLYPTLARIAGAAAPTDRAIDGLDQLDFITGKAERSARDGFPVYNGDTLQGYKWRNWKLHFKTQETMGSVIEQPGMPRLYNLLTDPKEQYDLIAHGGRDGEDNFWVMPAIMKLLMKHAESLAAEPPIPLGTPDPYEPANP
ncbi:GALNS [Symbiodinium necroappetens]|uniref:GALNS protein n=1 Tax=Symbiodinium necroappetens TaxID=1628268 RepID=A0A812IRQ1_9DINO|nr:GALNS [Symbiodinium necroappetens]